MTKLIESLRLSRKLVVISLVSYYLMGCFSVRTVEPPSSGNSVWVSPTDYEILLINLQTAINQQNTQNYLRCFNGAAFQFTPIAAIFNDNESVWINWSIQDEQAYFDNMLGDLAVTTNNSLILNELDLRDVTADSLTYIGNYTLRINHRDTTLSTLFDGQCQLAIKLNSFNEWEIHRWIDLAVQPDSSWSKLKLSYSQ